MVTIVPEVPEVRAYSVITEDGENIGSIRVHPQDDAGRVVKRFAFVPNENFQGLGEKALYKIYQTVHNLNIRHQL